MPLVYTFAGKDTKFPRFSIQNSYYFQCETPENSNRTLFLEINLMICDPVNAVLIEISELHAPI